MPDSFIPKNLNLWIAQSESWSTFMDFQLPRENMAAYPFFKRPDDFYVALFNKFFEIINSEGTESYSATELVGLARGMEIFSLDRTRREFKGVNGNANILYAASLYYLADFSASACFLASRFSQDDFQTEVEVFILSFLKRTITLPNTYNEQLQEFLHTGNAAILETLVRSLESSANSYLDKDIDLFVSYKLAVLLIKKFAGNNIWTSLLAQNPDNSYWQDFIEKNLFLRKVPVWDFFPSQKAALEKGVLLPHKAVALRMPTSSGKTAITELLIFNEQKREPANKTLFLAPFRALASELKTNFVRRLSNTGIKSKVMYGGSYATVDETEDLEQIDLLVSTPEKFISIEPVLPEVFNAFNTIICDEGHLLDDQNRGLTYELLLSRLKNGNNNRRFVFISAIVPNLADINKWLGGTDETFAVSNYRPTDVDFAFLAKRGTGFDLNVNPTHRRPKNYQLSKFLVKEDFAYTNPETGRIKTYAHASQKTLSAAVALKSVKVGPVALFCSQKGGNGGVNALGEEIAQLLSALQLPNPVEHSNSREKIAELKEYFGYVFGREYLLTTLIDFGTAIHHGDLPQFTREIIEKAFHDGVIRLIVCTNTLAEGVNLPIKVMVLHSVRRFAGGHNMQSIPARDLKNIVGRAGRAGKETKGLIIATNPDEFRLLENVIKDTDQEPIKGQLYRIASVINKYIRQKNIQLTNISFEEQEEDFKEWIDQIDVSLLDLMTEDIDVANLESIINSLAEKTFAYYQSSDPEKETLKSLFFIRGQHLKPLIEQGQLKAIKSSGATPRLYATIKERFDFNQPIWETLDDALSPEWLDYFLNPILELPQIKAIFEGFKNDTITPEVVKSIIKLWIDGQSYYEISQSCEVEVDLLLKIMGRLILYDLQIISTNIIGIAKLELEAQNKTISPYIINWPRFLQHGIKSKVGLDLMKLGFMDRIEILGISSWLDSQNFSYEMKFELRDYLLALRDDMLAHMTLYPKLILERIKTNLDLLEDRNIF